MKNNLFTPFIDKNRSGIMGVATLGVLMVHSNAIVKWPSILQKLFSFGGTGVYVFVFLSAMGLYYSLKKRGGGYSKKEFYLRRCTRVFIPYLIIAGTWYAVNDLLIMRSPLKFIYDLSTLSFWTEHQGAWYVAMLVPLYIVYPWFYDWVEKAKTKTKIIVILLGSIVVFFGVSISLPAFYHHLEQVFSSVIVFLIGYLYTKLRDEGHDYWLGFSLLCVGVFFLKALTNLGNYSFMSHLAWSMLGIPITFGSAIVLGVFRESVMSRFIQKMGKYSLEMYLWNIFLLAAYQQLGLVNRVENKNFLFGLVAYAMIVLCGVMLNVICNRILSHVKNM